MKDNLTEQELYFCELYITGGAPYAGNETRCYIEAFDVYGEKEIKRAKKKALQLLQDKRIQDYVDELAAMSYKEAEGVKRFIAENLKAIIEDCSHEEYKDKHGLPLSPAPLRSVAVAASKALMELYPVKEAQTSKLSIEGAGEGGITFNVIMPDTSKAVEPEDDTQA